MLREEIYKITSEFIEKARMAEGSVLVVGCSTSEITGEKIGSASRPEIAEEIYLGIADAARKSGIFIAAQCCEHLNRAIIIENILAEKKCLETVNVVPFPKAGGSFATAAYKYMDHPVAVEHIKADAGMDIGDTFIGMHLKDVAVPVRLSVSSIGNAHITFARTRPKFIGGERAHYNDELK